MLAFEENRNNLFEREKIFIKDTEWFIAKLKRKFKNSDYLNKLKKKDAVIFIKRDYKDNLEQLRQWKLDINTLKASINSHMIFLQEREKEIKLLELQKQDKFKFILGNDKYIELQRQIGLTNADIHSKDKDLVNQYKDQTHKINGKNIIKNIMNIIKKKIMIKIL